MKNIRRYVVSIVATAVVGASIDSSATATAAATAAIGGGASSKKFAFITTTPRALPVQMHDHQHQHHQKQSQYSKYGYLLFSRQSTSRQMITSYSTLLAMKTGRGPTSITLRGSTTTTAATIEEGEELISAPPTMGQEILTASSSSSSSTNSFNGNDTTTETNISGEETIAEGVVIAHFAGGMTAIKVSEELTSNKNNNNKSSKERTIQLTTDGLQVPKETTTVKVEVGDYQGKQVVFANGDVGYVVVHRPPLVYVYRDKDNPRIHVDDTDANTSSDHEKIKIMDTVATVEIIPEQNTVVDCFGRPIKTLYDINMISVNEALPEEIMTQEQPSSHKRSVFAPIPQVKDIALINTPMLTGITMIDTLASIGRGQNMLLVGHDLQTLRDVAVDMLHTQIKSSTNTNTNSNSNIRCIYAATEESADAVLERFQKSGIDGQVQIVSPKECPIQSKNDKASKAAEAVFIAATACAIGESYALNEGYHSLVVVDTIDYHKILWDCTTRVMVNEFGIDAVVKSDRDGGASSEMRGFFSSLIQRSAQYKENRNGGSVTLLLLVTIPKEATAEDENTVYTAADFEQSPAKTRTRIELLLQKNIPLTAANLRKINVPIPSASEGQRRFVLQHVDDLISMSDGQIWIDERLERMGRQPPVDPQRSVTRIGIGADTKSRADAPALRRIVEGLRLELSQAADVIVSKSNDPSNKHSSNAQNRRQLALLLALHQVPGKGGRHLSESCIVLLAAQKGHLDKSVDNGALAGNEHGSKLILDLIQFVQNQPDAKVVLANIDATMDMTDTEQETLNSAIIDFFSKQ